MISHGISDWPIFRRPPTWRTTVHGHWWVTRPVLIHHKTSDFDPCLRKHRSTGKLRMVETAVKSQDCIFHSVLAEFPERLRLGLYGGNNLAQNKKPLFTSFLQTYIDIWFVWELGAPNWFINTYHHFPQDIWDMFRKSHGTSWPNMPFSGAHNEDVTYSNGADTPPRCWTQSWEPSQRFQRGALQLELAGAGWSWLHNTWSWLSPMSHWIELSLKVWLLMIIACYCIAFLVDGMHMQRIWYNQKS